MRQTEVFDERRDADGTYYRAVHLNEDGSLTIEGHDVGPGVEAIFGDGCTEYEFERTLDIDAVRQLREALGIGAESPLLTLLKSRFKTTAAIEDFVDDEKIPAEFWSRIGE